MAINQLFGGILGVQQEQQLYFEQMKWQAANGQIQNMYGPSMQNATLLPLQLCDVTEERKLLLTGEIE